MCNECECGSRGHHSGGHCQQTMSFPTLSVEEEVKQLEGLREALEARLDGVNKRLEAVKR